MFKLIAAIVTVGGLSLVASEGRGENAAPVEEQDAGVVTEFGRFEQSLLDGQVHVNLRTRLEIADVEGFDTAHALTERLRLGYGTKPYEGVSFYVEVEDIRAADDDRYNAAGLNDNPDKTVIADPEDTELNQAYVQYDSEPHAATLKFGRQRLILDDARFVGNVGWRQNEQTFDAVTVKTAAVEGIDILYGFIWDVNRIFGPDADADFDSESHLINIAFDAADLGRVTVFGYFLDFDDQAAAAANSSDTFGVRLKGSTDVGEENTLVYIFSYAHQVDAGDNPTDYDAEYLLVELKLDTGEAYFGAAYELLGSDDGDFAFRTPLATGHKFNGWADVFLVTPADGLQDAYLFAGTTFSCGVKAKAVFHLFYSHEDGDEFGQELDLLLSKKLTDNITALAKYANFDGDNGLADVQKFTIEATLAF